jgi:hypothetical protein
MLTPTSLNGWSGIGDLILNLLCRPNIQKWAAGLLNRPKVSFWALSTEAQELLTCTKIYNGLSDIQQTLIIQRLEQDSNQRLHSLTIAVACPRRFALYSVTRAVITHILQTRWINDLDATLLFGPMDGYDLIIAKASSTEARRTCDIS